MSIVSVAVASTSVSRWQWQLELLLDGIYVDEFPNGPDVLHRGFAGMSVLFISIFLCGAFYLDAAPWPDTSDEVRTFPYWGGIQWIGASVMTVLVTLLPSRIIEYYTYPTATRSLHVLCIGELLGTLGVFICAVILISKLGLPATSYVRDAKLPQNTVKCEHDQMMFKLHETYDSATGAFHVLTALALGAVFRMANLPIAVQSPHEMKADGIAGIVAFAIALLLLAQNYTYLVAPKSAFVAHAIGAVILLSLPAWSLLIV